MRTITRFAAAILAAIGLSAFAWADIQVDNVSALSALSELSGLEVKGGSYSFVQFKLVDDRFAVTGAEALGEVVWVKSIGVVQRSGYTIAANSTLRIQQSTGTNADTGISNDQNEAVIAISQPLASSTDSLTVGTLRTYTFAAPFPLKKNTLYTAKFYNASGTAEDQQIAMYRDVTNQTQTTQNTNTSIHASKDDDFSPCVRIIAVERSKLADVGASANWSGLWPEAPAETDTVGLNVTAANATLTMDTPVTVAGLAIGSETAVGPLTLTGTGSLSSTTTTIATDTDVSAITANLGRVSIGSGKTLTVGDKGAFTSLTGTGGTLALDATDASISYTNTEAELEALRTYNGKVIFKGTNAMGVTLPYTIGKGTMSAKFAFDGGTHNFQYGANSERVLFGPQGTDDDPTLEVKNGATLNFCTKDLSGWKSSQNSEKVILRVRGSTLNFTQYSDENSDKRTAYFNNRLVLDNGATVDIQNDDGYFRMNGGVRNEEIAQLAMLGGETGTSATVQGNKIKLADDGSPGVGISVGAKATLTIENKIEGASGHTFAKYGSGTLVLSGAFTGSPITVNAGTLDFAVAEGTRPITVAISGSGTVKKSGAGTLKLTGTVSTPVEVAAGTLDLGTNRPTIGGIANVATLKLTATTAEVVAGAVELPTTLEAAPDKARFSVVDQEIGSVSLVNGTLTIRLASVTPTWTLSADGNTGSWNDGITAWPTSGTVIIDATALTVDATVALPASAAFGELIVLGSSAKTTLTVGAETTIMKLSPSGYVAMAVDAVNAITDTNPVTIAADGIFEVTTDGTATLRKAITGAGKFAKGGSGVLTLGENITTTGGSIVQSGELKFSSNGYINATSASYADATGDVLVKSGATLNLAGRGSDGGLLLREVTLEANATFKNETTNIGTEQRQFQKLTLLGDAIVVADKNFGLLASQHGETTLTLNGHTLTKQGSGNFWLMNARVNGGASGGKIVVEAGSITNTVANKPVTFSTPITLESTLTGTPFNLTGADVTASDNLTANGPVAFAKLITASGKTLAGTGTVTVTNMTLGGVLNVTGNLVINYTGDPRTFANAIKVAAAGSLTTKGNITWGSDSNEFLGSLTVASGTLSIKTPDQKLGGNITIASDAILKIAKTVTTTTTGVITGGGKLVIGDGSTASSVTLNGTLGTVTGTGESAEATHSSPIQIDSGSKLIFNSATPTVLTNAAISGAGSLTIAGSRTFTFGEGSNSSYSGATLVESGATLVLNCDINNDVGVLTAVTADTAAVTVNGTLKGLKGAFYRQVKGSGLIQVPSAGALTIGRADSGVTGIVAGFTGTIEVASEGTLSLPSWGGTHAVANCNITNDGKIEGGGGNNGTTTVTISNEKTLKGSGEILPNVTFKSGSSLDVSAGAPTLSVVSGTVTVTGYTKAVQPVLKTASEVTFAEIPDYTLPKSGTCYWLVKNTAKTLSAVATKDATWSALPWQSSDNMAVSSDIFMLGLDLTANVSASDSAVSTPYIGLDVEHLDFSKTALTLSGSTLFVLYEEGNTTPANFKSLTVTGVAAVEIAALNHVVNEVSITGTLYPLDSQYIFENITGAITLNKALTGAGTVAVLANCAVTMSSKLGSATNDLATFTGNLQVGRGATLTLTSPIKQELLGDIACADNTSRLVIGNGSQAFGLVLKGSFWTGQTASTFGGILAISKNSYFTFASSSAATVTGAVVQGTSGMGRLTVGDGTAASTLTVTGTLGNEQVPRMDESASRGIYNGAIEVAERSTLTVAPAMQTLLSQPISGTGMLVIGNGTDAQTVGLSAANTVSAVEVRPQATLELSAGNNTLLLPVTSRVTVAEGATLALSGGQLAASVSGSGEVSVPKGGNFTYCYPADAENALGAAKVEVAPNATLTLAAERNAVTLGVDLLVVNGSLNGTSVEGLTSTPKVSLMADQALGGKGQIHMPVELAENAILDGTHAMPGEALRLETVSLSSVKVKANNLCRLFSCPSSESTKAWQVENFTLQAGAPAGAKVVIRENATAKTTFVGVSIPPTMPADNANLPEAIAGNSEIMAAIQEKAEACLEFVPISEITSVTAKNSAGGAVSADGATLFTGLEVTVAVTPGEMKDNGTYKGTATVTYDFGVSDITVKSANLTGSAQLYVVVCAKVSNATGNETNTADYANDTTVSLLLDGATPVGVVSLTAAADFTALGLKQKVGERWFAVPLGNLKKVTNAFTVRASKNTPPTP